MTLVLAIGTRSHVVVVADRRLTTGTTIVTDNTNKLSELVARDGRVAVGFTGFAADRLLTYRRWSVPEGQEPLSAYVGPPGSASFRTGFWIPDALCNVADDAGCSLAPTVRAFADALADKLARLTKVSDGDKRLAAVFAGFEYDNSGRPIHRIYVVSNLGTNGLAHEVECATGLVPDGFYAIAYGNPAGMDPADSAALLEMAEADEAPDRIVAGCVRAIRRASADRASLNSVGGRCGSVTVPADHNAPTVLQYHGLAANERKHFPSRVVATDPPARVILEPVFTPNEKLTRSGLPAVTPFEPAQRAAEGTSRKPHNSQGARP